MSITVYRVNPVPCQGYDALQPQASSGRLLRLGLGSLSMALLLGWAAILGVADLSPQAESYDGRGKWSGYMAQQQLRPDLGLTSQE